MQTTIRGWRLSRGLCADYEESYSPHQCDSAEDRWNRNCFMSVLGGVDGPYVEHIFSFRISDALINQADDAYPD